MVVTSVVKVEFLRRVVRLATDRKHEGRSTVRKTLLKDKIVISYTHTHIYIIHEQNKFS
jgi:hypothetical protein